jgi:hypothetical protein
MIPPFWQVTDLSETYDNVASLIIDAEALQVQTVLKLSSSNSWTLLEVNVVIIYACLPMLKAPITRFAAQIRDRSTQPPS